MSAVHRNSDNHFAHLTAAARYAAGRPFVHPAIVARIAGRLPGGRVAAALDVGCGTGQSAVALTTIADWVAGLDLSMAMLAHAPASPNVAYMAGGAEALPFATASFDLLTVGLAFHWFERAAFLAEARRVLRPGGVLAIYNSAFGGRMAGNDAFARWVAEAYVVRYPTPARNAAPFTDADAEAAGFAHAASDAFEQAVRFGPAELVAYLTTQSNVIAAVEGGREDIPAASAWLLSEVTPLFPGENAAFPFPATVETFRRAAA